MATSEKTRDPAAPAPAPAPLRVLLVDDEPLFESNAIAEYLDETVEPKLHPADPMAPI